MSNNIHFIEKAYTLWEKVQPEEAVFIAKQKIIGQLFFEAQQKGMLAYLFYSFMQMFYPSWMEKQVERGLSAYKFDLIATGQHEPRIHLFSGHERWFIREKLTGVFKNILNRKMPQDAKGKAERWVKKVEKYSFKPAFLLSQSLVSRILIKDPSMKKRLALMKSLNLLHLEPYYKAAFNHLKAQHPTFVQGLSKYLEQPIDRTKNLSRIATAVAYCTAKATAQNVASVVKDTAWNMASATKNQVHSALSSARSLFP